MAECIKLLLIIATASRREPQIAVLVVAALLAALAACRHSHVSLPASAAKAPRKAVNVVLVVDRSGSLSISGSCTALSESAIYFAINSAPGRDKVGLVTFATTTYVDLPITSTFQTANPNIREYCPTSTVPGLLPVLRHFGPAINNYSDCSTRPTQST